VNYATKPHQDVATPCEHDDSMFLTSKFYLSGLQPVITPNVPEIAADYTEQAGQNYLFCLPDIREVEIHPAEQRLQMIRIQIDLEYLSTFWTDFDSLPPTLKNLINSTDLRRFHQSLEPNTMAMQSILHQILHCPFTGMVKRMYLEAKTLELLALQLSEWQADQQKGLPHIGLSPDDIDRIHQAKHILLGHSDDPPSLQELARQVGLNRRKLMQGFREVFGTTAFGCLSDYRMEQAKQLLIEGRLRIAEVAEAVGYSSRSAFYTAFRKKFGVNPRSHRV
jgi:AraC-like DNA-binding protein